VCCPPLTLTRRCGSPLFLFSRLVACPRSPPQNDATRRSPRMKKKSQTRLSSAAFAKNKTWRRRGRHLTLRDCSVASQSLFSRCSAAVQSLFSRCSAAVQPLFSRCSAAVQPLFSRCSVAVLSLFSRCSAAVQPLFSRCSAAVQPLFSRCSVAVQPLFSRCSVAVQSLFSRILSLTRFHGVATVLPWH